MHRHRTTSAMCRRELAALAAEIRAVEGVSARVAGQRARRIYARLMAAARHWDAQAQAARRREEDAR